MYNDYDYIYKLLVVGNSGVGKSSLLLRFAEDKFTELFESTIGVDFKIKYMTVNDKIIKLQLWDSAGNEQFRSITKCYYKGTSGVIIVYDVTDVNSFNNIKTWVNDIKENSDNMPFILVGNKTDLDRKIPYEQAKELADSLNIEYIETSSKNNKNIEKVFMTIVEEIKEYAIKNNILSQYERKNPN